MVCGVAKLYVQTLVCGVAIHTANSLEIFLILHRLIMTSKSVRSVHMKI